MNKIATMTTTNQDGVETRDIDQVVYDRMVDSIGWFRNLGGKEIVEKDSDGRIVKITSISPSGKDKVVYEFVFV